MRVFESMSDGPAETGHPQNHPLADLISHACGALPSPSGAAAGIIARLDGLAARLAEQRLQLAVLGQFKRGKSTLLNALLGAQVLPTAVTPLTAIPTFVAAGDGFRLRTVRLSGETEEAAAPDAEGLRTALAGRVTEDANPENRLGIARVEVTVPLLPAGVTLLDTPGVGSTFRHNTETAEAILPECDAALFVVSPDPPITATEIEYLSRIRATAPHIVLVLNKIDTVEPEDREAAIAFLRRVAAGTAGLAEAPMFCVSARGALRAKLAGDQDALRESGFEKLEAYLARFIAGEKTAALERAVAVKAAGLVRELRFEAEAKAAALRMPAEQLSQRIAQFEEAARGFAAERNVSHDLIAGDRKRLLAELDEEARGLHERVCAEMETALTDRLAGGAPEDAIVKELSERVPAVFQTEFERLESLTRQRFGEALGAHRQRAEELIAKVRRTAADLLSIDHAAPVPEDALALKKVPYWVTTARETLRVVPPGAFDGLLPAAWRRRRVRERYLAQTGEIVTRNVENLRWSLRRNLEDGFLAFEDRMDGQLERTLAATFEAMRRGLERRAHAEAQAQNELTMLRIAAELLAGTEAALQERAHPAKV